MESLLDHYPLFEANQVLMSRHLNDAFEYLEQQQRQTRSHLIGIGIACGLKIQLDGAAITLSKGCGVTSQGYLIEEPEDVTLTTYRPYTLPTDIDYPTFKSDGSPFAMWELFGDGVPNTTPLGTPAGFLDDKAVLLFLELKKEGLRTCSPNNCDDKGSQVTATVRRLLMARSDLDKIIAAANSLGSGLSESDLVAALSARLNLPDLRLRRFDVPNSNPVSSSDVYTAFLEMVRQGGLASATGQALSAAYAAFRPLLLAEYPTDPFSTFGSNYGFLDSAPVDTTQVKFLQYYADLFDDLLHAYDEFRWKGLELMCACCPDDGMFPRHLMLGLLHPESVTSAAGYRQGFLPSPAVGNCEQEGAQLGQLFARLVAMCAAFTNQPKLPPANPSLPFDPQIRITPSCSGKVVLDVMAIPYFYAKPGAPPLYPLWSPLQTRRQRANQNLGYNSDLYAPAAPAFVTDPLRYDLGSHDFLRIEGHLGKDYQSVLRSLLTMKAQYRLPIDVIALRTGAYDDSQPVDLSQEQARFQDLDALYGSLSGELRSQLVEGIMQLYNHPIAAITGLPLSAGAPQLSLLKQYAPQFTYKDNTIGAWYEHYLTRFENQGYIDVDQNAINSTAVLYLYCALFNGTQGPENAAYPHVVSIYYFSKLAEALDPSLSALNYADFQNKYQDLMALIRYLRSDVVYKAPTDLQSFLPQDEFIDLCEGVLMGCKLDAIKSVRDQFQARIGELRRLQFLSSFLQREPGIQHKAGVPLGGTFIVVYHGDTVINQFNGGFLKGLERMRVQSPVPLQSRNLDRKTMPMKPSAAVSAVEVANAGIDSVPNIANVDIAAALNIAPAADASADTAGLMRAIGNLSANRALIKNDDLHVVMDWLTGRTPVTARPGRGPRNDGDTAAAIIGRAVDELNAGTVIADFFLPYRLSGSGPGIQYVLPKMPPIFTVAVGCTAPNGSASISIDATGGVPPYDVAADGGAYQPLGAALSLSVGNHSVTLRDAVGAETPMQSFSVASPLIIGEPSFTCTGGSYTASAAITGGTPPYEVNGQPATMIVTGSTLSGAAVSVTVRDSKGCAVDGEFTHECCTLPCGGASLKRNFRFFLPDPDANPDIAYQEFKADNVVFTVDAAAAKPIDLSAKIADILVATKGQLSGAQFQNTVNSWMKAINELIASTPGLSQPGKAQWLTLGYKSMSPGRFGVLTLEYFKCLGFHIELDAIWTVPNATQQMRFAYSPDGTLIKSGDNTLSVPASDGISIDKCSETPTPVNLCPSPPKFAVELKGSDSVRIGDKATFAVRISPSQDAMTLVWEAQGGTPTMGKDLTFETSFNASGTQLVTVTAFDVNGCSVTQTMGVKVVTATKRPPIIPSGPVVVRDKTPVVTKRPAVSKVAAVQKPAVAKTASHKVIAKKAAAKKTPPSKRGSK
ncbi:hypothetical protein PY254_10930 [Rhodanobacter sp. AS-Z3]|uniref:hypothetical protein n=1 Tax=Rhodanobacter sp. AS-Z3 TaxID=3031330 RepID=UPI0024790062|nr:hypothetical protein [Rhodanobacter sp. AS-Z3]WEN13758.1 hypothetical protein PY254_10930 [Rhodanobacter sp. AS-Z3]